MRLHVVGLPHTETTRAFSWCAYTQKVRRFCDMMTSLGHEVILYAGEANEAACTEHVPCITRGEQAEHFKEAIPAFDSTLTGWMLFACRAIAAIVDRHQPGDYLCLIAGLAQQPIADEFPQLVSVEFGVGYGGVFAPFRVFESYAWMHTVYGATQGAHEADGRFYDTVIPNSFEADELPLGDGAGGYLLYIGRLIARKGLQVVADIAQRTGLPLVVAGAGDHSLIPPGAEYVGVVEPKQRAELYGGALATLVPTLYLEPFGGVAVESQMCGTPAITTDWGAFTETVSAEWRCRTLAEFCMAVHHAESVDRRRLHQEAQRWSTGRVRHQYGDYFDRLDGLKRGGWYA